LGRERRLVGENEKRQLGGKYDQTTLYTCMKMSTWNSLFCTINAC
jgi:hypothetical protein